MTAPAVTRCPHCGELIEPSATRTYTLLVRLTEAERRALFAAADAADVTVSDYVRRLVFRQKGS